MHGSAGRTWRCEGRGAVDLMGDEGVLRRALESDCPSEQLGEWGEAWLYERWEVRFAVAVGPPDELLGEALAAHPNTPPDVLVRLAAHHPEAFCRNPVAALLPLEDPAAFDEWELKEAVGLLRRHDAPASLLGLFAARSPDAAVREEASLHVTHAGEVARTEGWLDDAGRTLIRVRAWALRGDNRAALNLLIREGHAPRWLLPEREITPPRWLAEPKKVKLRRHGAEASAPGVLRCAWLSGRKATPCWGWRGDSAGEDWWNRLGLALNPSFAAEEPVRYAALADDVNRYVRAAARARLRGEDATL